MAFGPTVYSQDANPVFQFQTNRETERRLLRIEGGINLTSQVLGVLPMANGGTGVALTDPGADKVLFWDDSAGVFTWLTVGDGLIIAGTTVTFSAPDSVAGDILVYASDAVITPLTTAYVKFKEVSIPKDGTLRIKFDLESSGGGNTAGRIYRNGVAVGTERIKAAAGYTTYSEDISGWTAGDLCQLYLKKDIVDGNAKNFRIYEGVGTDYVERL